MVNFREMKQTNENNQDIKNIENKVPEEKHTLDGKHHDGTSQSSVNSVATKNDIHPAVCFYKPSPSPILRQKQRPISIFEICPKDTEITEVKDICIETGTKQNVMESHSNLPALTSNVHILDGCTLTDLPTTRRTPKSSDKHFEVSDLCQGQVVVGKDNGWIGKGSNLDTPRIPQHPPTPPASSSIRRRSLGVLKTPACSLRTYRDHGSHSPCYPRRKSLTSENRRTFGQNDTSDEGNSPNINCGEEFEEFRPRLRSRSLDDSRTLARENVLKKALSAEKSFQQETPRTTRRQNRRKSFEVWLADKEQETVRKLHMLALEKQRESEEALRKLDQRKGKTYAEWLCEKNNMAAAKSEICSHAKNDESKTQQENRQDMAKRRYDKWLMDKEIKALEEEREMLKQAQLKTIEMRKSYEKSRKHTKLRQKSTDDDAVSKGTENENRV